MKKFENISFSARRCSEELERLRRLLAAKKSLCERKELKPWFEHSRQLSAFIGTFVPDLGPADLLAYEFEIAGDFVADIVVGSRETQTYCMVELEEATPRGVFKRGVRGAKEWSPRFDHGFSQLVDWFYALDDLKGTEKFAGHFGYGHAKFHGLLVIGRSSEFSAQDSARLRWRSERVLVNSHPIHCVTYDELHQHLSRRMLHYTGAAERGEPPRL